MAHFTLDARGRAIVIDLPADARPIHPRGLSRERRRSAFVFASLPDGRTVPVLVNVLVTQRDGSRHAFVHQGERLWRNYLKRDAVRAAARRAEAALRYRFAAAA